MFKGHPRRITGCDIDGRLVDWINGHLPHMTAVRTDPAAPLPFEDDSFDRVISVSVPGGILIFTTHGAISVGNMKLGGLDAVFDESGFFWDMHSDQLDLDSTDYGTSAVTLAYVERCVKSFPQADLIRFQQAFWWHHQDIYVVEHRDRKN